MAQDKRQVDAITARDVDFAQWYTDVCKKAELIDYSSINIAKRFHIGHLSTTMIGNSLYKLHQFFGYRAVGVNHLGDWGTQFGKMIAAYKRWGDRDTVAQGGVDELKISLQ